MNFATSQQCFCDGRADINCNDFFHTPQYTEIVVPIIEANTDPSICKNCAYNFVVAIVGNVIVLNPTIRRVQILNETAISDFLKTYKTVFNQYRYCQSAHQDSFPNFCLGCQFAFVTAIDIHMKQYGNKYARHPKCVNLLSSYKSQVDVWTECRNGCA